MSKPTQKTLETYDSKTVFSRTPLGIEGVGKRYVLVDDEDIHSPQELKVTNLPPVVTQVSTLSMSAQRAMVCSRIGGMRNNGRSGGGWENYSVRLVASGNLTSTAGGVVAQSFLCDPTSLPLSEWSTFASLFDEVKITGFCVALAPYQSTGNSANFGPLNVGSFTRTTATPASAVAVLVAPDSVLTSSVSQAQLSYKHKMDVPRDILFAATSSPAPGPYAGCPGSIQCYGSGFGVSIATHVYAVIAHYHLRGRL